MANPRARLPIQRAARPCGRGIKYDCRRNARAGFDSDFGLAGEEGFEPSNGGIKIRCLNQLGDSPARKTVLHSCAAIKTLCRSPGEITTPARDAPAVR